MTLQYYNVKKLDLHYNTIDIGPYDLNKGMIHLGHSNICNYPVGIERAL